MRPISSLTNRVAPACAAVLAAGMLALAVRPVRHVFDTPMTEDAFYALSVARNAAAGNGFAIEPGVLTNGFQPLFTVLEAGAFLIAAGDMTVALRLVMVLAWTFHLGGALVVARIAAEAVRDPPGMSAGRVRALWAALLYLAAPLLLNHAYNGLETGCALFFYALLFRWLQRGGFSSLGGAVTGGAIAGLLVLARIDAGIVVGCVAAAEVLRAAQDGRVDAVRRAAAFGTAAFTVSAPWWLFNVMEFGSPIPTSGLAQQELAISAVRVDFALSALAKVLVPWVYLGTTEAEIGFEFPVPGAGAPVFVSLFAVVRTLVIVAAIALLLRARRRREPVHAAAAGAAEPDAVRETRRAATAMLVGTAALVAYYTFDFTAYWFYYRYFAPLSLLSVIVAAVWIAHTLGERGRAGIAIALAVQALVLVGLAVQGRGLFGQSTYHDQVALVREHVPDGELVAAGQSGTLGFFRDGVVNLDGKVNREVIAYQTRMLTYLRQRGIRWFCDWPHYAGKYLGIAIDPRSGRPSPEGNGWRLVAERNYFFLYADTMPRRR